MGEATCPVCGSSFARVKHNKRFCSARCKQFDWRSRNREKSRQYLRDARTRDPERYRDYQRVRRAKDPEHFVSLRMAAYQRDPERFRARSRNHYHANRDASLERMAEYRAIHPEKKREAESRRRARRRNAQIIEQFGVSDVVAVYGSQCYLCDCALSAETMHIDHVVPLSRGGVHSLANVRPTCQPCNQSKYSLLWHELKDRAPEMARRIRLIVEGGKLQP